MGAVVYKECQCKDCKEEKEKPFVDRKVCPICQIEFLHCSTLGLKHPRTMGFVVPLSARPEPLQQIADELIAIGYTQVRVCGRCPHPAGEEAA